MSTDRYERFLTNLIPAGWRSGNDIANGAGGLGFDSLADPIGHSVVSGSPPMRRFFCVAQAQRRGDGPRKLVTRFGVLRGSIMKIWF